MSRVWKRKDKIFVFDQNTLILSNKIEDLIFKLQSSVGVHIDITNIVDTYIEKIKEIVAYLEKYDIDYYSSNFTLGTLISESLLINIDNAEKELIRAINKTKHPIYKNFNNTNFAKLFIRTNILNYRKYINDIKSYNFEEKLESIIEYKYVNMDKEYLKTTRNKDIKMLNKLNRKELIFFINNCITK